MAATPVAFIIPKVIFKPSIYTCKMSLGIGMSEHALLLVRDTASAQSIINKSAFPNVDHCRSEEKDFLQVLEANPSTRNGQVPPYL